MDKQEKIQELKNQLKELQKNQDPSHCHGREGHIPHQIQPEIFQKIEDIEDEIKKLESEA